MKIREVDRIAASILVDEAIKKAAEEGRKLVTLAKTLEDSKTIGYPPDLIDRYLDIVDLRFKYLFLIVTTYVEFLDDIEKHHRKVELERLEEHLSLLSEKLKALMKEEVNHGQ